MARNCAYTCTDSNGNPITLVGPSALKTFLVQEGLETLFPDRDFTKLPVSRALADADKADMLRDSRAISQFDRRQNHEARVRYDLHKARKAANSRLATELRYAKRELRTNPTTGIPNKRAFFEGELPQFVASIDIDSLKYVNDNMGHSAGDDLLRIAARVLAKNVDAYHVSGDEIWAKGNDREALEKGLKDAVAELRSGAYQIVSDDAVFSKPGFSYGVAATDPNRGTQQEALEYALKRADLTMLDQKEAREKTGERAPRGEAPDGFVRNNDANEKTTVPQRPLVDNLEDAKAATAFLAGIFGPGVNRLVNGGVVTFTKGKETWPEAAKASLRGDEEAVYFKGRAYIDLDAITRERLPGVLLHEIGEHFNLSRMLGAKAYAALQNQIRNQANVANSPAAKVWAEVKRNYPHLSEGNEEFTAEVIAKLGERNPKLPWYRRLLAQIKSFLINLGLGKAFIAGTMTDKDLHALLVASLKSAAKRERMNEARLFDSTRDEDREVRMSRPDLPDTINIDGKDRLTRNSNGQPIHPTEEGIRNFYEWFKDSKVVDAAGRPLVVYHGTDKDFSEFDLRRHGEKDHGFFGVGHYFTPHADTASAYADYNEPDDGQNLIPVYLSIQKPFQWEQNKIAAKNKGQAQDVTDGLAALGHDGVFAENQYFKGDNADKYEIVAFNANQIKSATSNTGAFSAADADIRFSRPDILNVDGVDRPTVNSDGKPIHTTEEGIRNFWKWFGDSKVVDADGRPKVVYHGTGVNYSNKGERTGGDFSVFDPSLSGKSSKTGAPEGTFFFTDAKDVANSYGVKYQGDFTTSYKDQAQVMPVYLAITKPEKINAKGENWREVIYKNEYRDLNEIAAMVREKGTKDGLITTKIIDKGVGTVASKNATTYVAFNANQIKSATGNTGAFSAADADIRFSRPDTEAPASEPKEPSTWDKTKTKLANMGDAAFSERLAFLSAIQVADIAEKIIPYAKNYIVGMRNRRREIDTWLRKADQTVSKWRGLSYAERTALNKTIHGSTLADMDVSMDWTGVKETEVPSYMNFADGERYTKKYYAYTQAVLSTNAAGQLKDLAGRQALKVTKNGAEFSTAQQAAIFLDKLRAVEQTGGLPTNVARKEKFDALRRDYAALPDKAKAVYAETNSIHGELFEAKMAALEERIHDAIIDKAKASELIQSMRAQFESGSLNWYYAPLSRFGKHWFYGVDKDGQNWFRSFESEQGRNQAEKEFKKLNGETSIVGHGSNVKDLLNMRTEGTSDAFILSVKQLLEDKLPKEVSDDMADDIYQMYLSTLPDVSMRHNAQHRKGTLGFEEDALRSFGFAVHHGASQVANMTHGRYMQKVLSEMEEAIHITEFPSRRADMERDIEAIKDLEDNWEEWSVPGVVEDFVNDAETDTEIKYAAAIQKQFERVKDDEEPMDGLMYAREKREHTLEVASELNHANLRKAVDVLNELRANYVAMTMTNSTAMDQIAGFARQVGFTWMLGFGLSSGVMNMAQTPVVAIPIVMGKHGIVPTTKAFNAAYADFAKAVSIMFRKDANGNPTGVDADGNASMTQVYRDKIAAGGLSFDQRARYERLIQALERFKNDGTLSRTQTFDVIGVGQEGETYGGKMQEWSKKMGWMFHQAERANREITLVAAMNLALDKGMHIDDAMEYAKKVVDDAHGEYSPENAPRIFRGWLPSIALQFKKYPQMMLYLWGKTASDALSKWKDLPPGPERDAAQQKSKEAFGTLGALFLAQVSVAGVFGLPMMGSLGLLLNALANAVGDDDEPDWDWQQELRVGATSLFGETAATALTTGFFNALTPANVGSRMSLAEPVFRPPLQELEGQDAATHYLAEMWGPFGGIIQRLFQSQKLMADGHYMRAAEYATPKFVGDAIKSFRFAKEGAQTINGEPMKDMSAMEELLQLAGFGSSELEKLYAERGYVKSAEAQLQERRKTIQHSAARAKLEGTEYPMADVVAWNERHPNWRITAETVKQAMDRIKENRAAKGERGYTVNPKLDYLIEENTLRDDADDD